MTTLFKSHDGIIKFYDGTIIAIENQQYSSDGKTNWEYIFNPLSHISTIDGITVLEGHKYKRVKHSGDTDYQLPYRIIPKEVEFRIYSEELQWKFIEDSNWTTLFTLNDVKGADGDTGEQGIPGEGLHIDNVGYYLNRPDCCLDDVNSSNCASCNRTSTAGYNYSTFLSLGDGMYEIQVGDIGTLWRSNDGTVWVSIVASDVGNLTRYTATDNIGTGSIDYRTQDTLNTRGKVYICAAGTWTEFINLAIPSYMVREFAGSTHIGFMDSYTAPTAPTLTATIVLSNGKLEIAEQSVNETAFDQTTFGDGIEITNPMDKPKVQISDVIGFGLRDYISLVDGENDAQIYVQDFISDGITFENDTSVDGEQRDLLLLQIADVLNAPNTTNTNYTGLATSTQLGYIEDDGYENLYINTGDALYTDVDGLNVNADELTILADGLAELILAETDSLTLGVQAKHLHKNAVNELAGLWKTNNTTGQFEVKPDTTRGSIGFNIIGEVEVPDNGIQGVHLNGNVADNTRGIEVLNDMLVIKVDGTSIDFNGSGELEIPSTYLNNVIADNTVTSIIHGGISTVGDVALVITNNNNPYNIYSLDAIATHNIGSDDVLNLILDFDQTAFENTVKALIDEDHIETRLENILQSSDGTIDISFNASANTVDLTIASTVAVPGPALTVASINGNSVLGTSVLYARADHRHSVDNDALIISNTQGLQTALDTKLELDVDYGNITIRSTGLYIRSNDGTAEFRLIIDNNGNLDTI